MTEYVNITTSFNEGITQLHLLPVDFSRHFYPVLILLYARRKLHSSPSQNHSLPLVHISCLRLPTFLVARKLPAALESIVAEKSAGQSRYTVKHANCWRSHYECEWIPTLNKVGRDFRLILNTSKTQKKNLHFI